MGGFVHMTCTAFPSSPSSQSAPSSSPSSSSCSQSALQDIHVNHQHHGRNMYESPPSSQHGDHHRLLRSILVQEEQKLELAQMGPSGSYRPTRPQKASLARTKNPVYVGSLRAGMGTGYSYPRRNSMGPNSYF